MSQNMWLKDYAQRIGRINYTIEECIMKGTSDTILDLREVLTLFKGSVNEIKNLQNQIDVLKIEMSKLKEK